MRLQMEFCVLLIGLICLLISNGARILFIPMPHSRSHLNTMLPFAKKLANRGHNVTIYVEFMRSFPDLPDGLRQIYLEFTQKASMEQYMAICWKENFVPYSMLFPYERGVDSASQAVKTEQFWKMFNETWDLLIVDELFSSTGYGMALAKRRKMAIPIIMYGTTDTMPSFCPEFSLGRQLGLYPSFFLRHEPHSWNVHRFADRLNSLSDYFRTYLYVNIVSQRKMQSVVAKIGRNNNEDFAFAQFFNAISLALIDYPDRLAYPQANGNNFIYTGSYCVPGRPLTDELEQFVASPESRGTIYIAFGATIRWQYAPPRILNAFVSVMNNLSQYRIIWSYSGHHSLPVLNHVKLIDWAPQRDILGHGRTKLFISHGGLKSMKEAICAETPVAYMPLFAEQCRNSLLGKQLGFAEYINKRSVTTDSLKKTLLKLLTNDIYKRNIIRVKSLFIDRIIEPLEESVYWTEKVIRYKGRQVVFHRRGMQLSWFTYLYLDFICFTQIIVIFLATY